MIKDLSCLGDEVQDQSSGTCVAAEVCDQIIAFYVVILRKKNVPPLAEDQTTVLSFFGLTFPKKKEKKLAVHCNRVTLQR